MIVVSQDSNDKVGDEDEGSNDLGLIHKPALDSGRHLKGNMSP